MLHLAIRPSICLVALALCSLSSHASSRSAKEHVAREIVQALGGVDLGVESSVFEFLSSAYPEEPPELWQELSKHVGFNDLEEDLIASYSEAADLDALESLRDELLEEGATYAKEASDEGSMSPTRRKAAGVLLSGLLSSDETLEAMIRSSVSSPILDTVRLRRTVADIRNVGTALMSWLVDLATNYEGEVPKMRKTLGEATFEVRLQQGDKIGVYHLISAEELTERLVPRYIEAIPKTDGWGHPYQYALNQEPLGSHVFGIRSPGRDGALEPGLVKAEPYSPEDFDHDLTWVDGFFVQWPSRDEATDRK